MWRLFPHSRVSAIQDCLYAPPDVGAGSGGTGDAGAGPGAGGTGAGPAGAGAGTPYKLTDDSLVDLGDGKPQKWSEARTSRYMPKDEYQKGVDFLLKVAEGFDKAKTPAQKPAAAKPATPAADPFEGLDDLPIVDGRTLAKLGRQITQQGFAPLGQVVAQMGKRMEALEKRLQSTEGSAGSLAERESTRDFEDHVTKVVTEIPEVKGLGTIDPKEPAVRELMKDLWLSHDQKDPALMREYPALAAKRVADLFALFTKMQQAAVKASKDKARAHFDPAKGRGQGTGEGKYEHLTGTQIAARAREMGMFDNRQST